MSLKKLPDSEIERLIDLWKNEPVSWDVRCACYSNADDRKAALLRISQEIGLQISNLCFIIIFLKCIIILQCFDTVGWAAGRASGL